MNPVLKIAICLSAVSLLPVLASAHRDDYLNETFVFQTLDRGEVELEYWFDYHEIVEAGAGHFQHTLSTEYGFTQFWMADIALNIGNLSQNRTYELSRWRAETRRRFSEEGAHPLDLAVSLELEGEHVAGNWDYQLTPRLVSSHDFHRKLNATLNLFAGIGLEHESAISPGYNLGLRYPGEGKLRIGVEVIQTREHDATISLIIPQVWLLPWTEDVIKIGYARGFGSSEKYFIRLAVEAGIG